MPNRRNSLAGFFRKLIGGGGGGKKPKIRDKNDLSDFFRTIKGRERESGGGNRFLDWNRMKPPEVDLGPAPWRQRSFTEEMMRGGGGGGFGGYRGQGGPSGPGYGSLSVFQNMYGRGMPTLPGPLRGGGFGGGGQGGPMRNPRTGADPNSPYENGPFDRPQGPYRGNLRPPGGWHGEMMGRGHMPQWYNPNRRKPWWARLGLGVARGMGTNMAQGRWSWTNPTRGAIAGVGGDPYYG